METSERNVGYRGSKSAVCESIVVKEPRADGSWRNNAVTLLRLRCALSGYENNHQFRILSKELYKKEIRFYSTTGNRFTKNETNLNP